jgi:hypothetical protein
MDTITKSSNLSETETETETEESYILLELSEYEDTNLLTTCKNYSIIVCEELLFKIFTI